MAARDDPQFAKDIMTSTANAVAAYQVQQFNLLDNALSSVPMDYHNVPFRQHMIESNPILALRARVEKVV